MKTVEEITPNYAPVYAAAIYPKLCGLFQKHGYALAVHGSLARDFDLIAVPWAESISNWEFVLDDIVKQFNVRIIGDPETRRYGRVAYTLSVGHGTCSIDLSFLNLVYWEEQE